MQIGQAILEVEHNISCGVYKSGVFFFPLPKPKTDLDNGVYKSPFTTQSAGNNHSLPRLLKGGKLARHWLGFPSIQPDSWSLLTFLPRYVTYFNFTWIVIFAI